MKTIYIYLLCLLPVLAYVSCTDKFTEEFTANAPVYMSYETLRTAVKTGPARNLINPGKIYFKDNYILITEKSQGIHIIDVSTPASPKNTGFIELPGCIDIAVRNNTLYADSYVDLVALDVSDLSKIKETARIKNAFPYTVPATENDFPITKVEKEKGVVIGWDVITEHRELETQYYPVYPMYNEFASSDKLSTDAASGGISGSGFGKSGSMARFGLYDKYLYTIDNYSLFIFDISNTPINIGQTYINWNVETMFVYDKHLFFGTTNGMMIYSLQVPTAPVQAANFWHATSCDPVVVQNGYAYITLRGGQQCHADFNRLDVVSLSGDYKTIQLVASYNMTNPHGLGIDNNTLFVCDGEAGLKVFDATDKTSITSHQLAVYPNIKTYDVIPANGFLFMIGSDGFYLYDYSNLHNITQLSHIPITHMD